METGDNHGFVTHDQDEALTMGNRIAVMNKGRITQVGAPTGVYTFPANTLVAGFIGRTNHLSPDDLLIVSEPTVDSTGGRAGMPGARAGHLLIDTRAEAMKIGEAMLVRIEDLGHEAPLHLNIRCGAALTARASGEVRGKSRQARQFRLPSCPTGSALSNSLPESV